MGYQNQYTMGPINSKVLTEASTIVTDCRLARENPHWPGILDLFGQSKITSFEFLVDLKVQSKHLNKNCPIRSGSLLNF